MSCVVAFVDLTGAPAERARLVHVASVRPYDAGCARTFLDGAAGLAAAPLPGGRAGLALAATPQDTSIAAVLDGRLDDRADLVRRLSPRLTSEAATVSDADLIVAAYLQWGADAPAHLTGDFAWCLWDGRERRLVCARDHFGVRPLYYAANGRALVVSNAVTSLRRAGLVSDRLQDRAVGDLLLFGDPQEPGDTMLADVHRVPAAHVLTWTPSSGPAATAYWRCEAPPPLRGRDAREPVHQFRATLQRAVDDRVGESPVTVLMSGGLDSTTVATLAVPRAPAARARVRALTSAHHSLFEDHEPRFAALAAEALGIPLDVHAADGYTLFDRWSGDACPVLPMAEPLTALIADLFARASAHSTVALSGDGGDPLLFPATLPRQIGKVPLADLASGVWRLARRYRRPPRFGLRTAFRRMRAKEPPPPVWLSARLRSTYEAESRRREVAAAAKVEAGVLRPEALRNLRSGWWASLFESLHPAATGRALDVRYPFFDRRVVAAGLALPSYPWCVGKIVLREATAGRLPEAVRLRPKAPLGADPVAVRRTFALDDVVGTLRHAPGLDAFVDAGRFAAAVDPDGLLLDAEPGTLAAMSLALWLTHAPRS